MTAVKQRFAQSYHSRLHRQATGWEERSQAVSVQGTDLA
jgi:hypothetical protein